MRTVSLTSDEGVEQNQKKWRNASWISDFGCPGWHDRQNNVTKNGDHDDDDEEEEADDYDDECIRWEKVYVTQLRCLALSRCRLLKVMNGERNLTD